MKFNKKVKKMLTLKNKIITSLSSRISLNHVKVKRKCGSGKVVSVNKVNHISRVAVVLN